MFLSILHRMITWELLKIFLISMLAITGIMLMGGAVVEATQHGFGLWQILVAIPLLIPSLLPWTIPTTTLFAACLVYGRMSADNEVLAIRAAGVNVLRIVWPAVLLGLLISAGTMGLYYRIIPYTHRLLRTIPMKDIKEILYAKITRDHGISYPHLDYSLYVRQVQGRKLRDATFKKHDKKGGVEMVVNAQEAELDVDLDRRKLVVTLHYADVVHLGGGGGTNGFVRMHREEVDLTGALAFQRPPRPSDMTWKQLHEYRAEMEKAVSDTHEQLRAAREGRATEHRPEDLPKHIENLVHRQRYFEGEVRYVDVEFHLRPALSLGCLCFVLVGCPVGIWFGRSDYLSAFITCFLPIVSIYYPLMFCGTNFAKEGKFPPSIAVWAADALLVLVGLAFAIRLARR